MSRYFFSVTNSIITGFLISFAFAAGGVYVVTGENGGSNASPPELEGGEYLLYATLMILVFLFLVWYRNFGEHFRAKWAMGGVLIGIPVGIQLGWLQLRGLTIYTLDVSQGKVAGPMKPRYEELAICLVACSIVAVFAYISREMMMSRGNESEAESDYLS